MIIEDFKNEKGEWAYTSMISGEKCRTVGGSYYDGMKNRYVVGGSVQRSNPTYVGCTTTFKSCDNFIEWARNQVGYGTGQLDKDILLKGNKVYRDQMDLRVHEALLRYEVEATD